MVLSTELVSAVFFGAVMGGLVIGIVMGLIGRFLETG